jgi:leucyl aminopeptidase
VQQEFVESCFPSVSSKRQLQHISALAGIETRYYKSLTGVGASAAIAEWYSIARGDRDDISVGNVLHIGFPQPSVIATIEGAGPHADEVVILGGHLDSIGSTATGRSPGADDDASGTATVLEVFTALVENGFRPDRTVEFHAYAAEEVGLRGSQAIAATYERRGIKVVSMLQFDMVGYVTKERGGPIGIISDYTDPELSAFIKKLVGAYTTLTLEDSECGYACSDHASFTKAGYRSAFAFETPFPLHNPNIHTANDTIATGVNEERIEQFARLGLGYVVEMAIV